MCWPLPSGPKDGHQFVLSIDTDYFPFRAFTSLNELPVTAELVLIEDVFA